MPPIDPAAPTVLLLDTDPALRGLVSEWLLDGGYHVRHDEPAPGPTRPDLIVVDVPFPRQGGSDRLRRLADRHPGTPVLALSPTFLSGAGRHGAVARELGVAGVLPKPLTRDALLVAVTRLLAAES